MTHLSSTQIYEWALGDHNPDTERHLTVCARCREEIMRLQEGLLAFKHGVHDLAEQMADAETHAVRSAGVSAGASWRWAAAVAMATTFALLPLFLNVAQSPGNAQTAEDSLLLNRVNDRLARFVPQPMEQLMKLMNDEGDASQ